MPENSQSVFPGEMQRVAIPEGTKMYGYDRVGELGVKDVLYGRIRTLNENPGEPVEYVDGSVITFGPHESQAHVIRRDLSAEDINLIGEKMLKLARTSHILNGLPPSIKAGEDMVRNLTHISLMETTLSENEGIDDVQRKIISDLEELGTVMLRLKQQLDAQKALYDELVSEAGDLGVSYLSMISLDVGTIDVGKILKDRRSKQ